MAEHETALPLYYQPCVSRYGGRGITVCERWMLFENFRADMGERPSGATLGRIDNNGNYEPSNCRWETLSQQGRNKRTSRTAFYMGKERSLAEIAEMTGTPYRLLYERIVRLGWSVERAVKEYSLQ